MVGTLKDANKGRKVVFASNVWAGGGVRGSGVSDLGSPEVGWVWDPPATTTINDDTHVNAAQVSAQKEQT